MSSQAGPAEQNSPMIREANSRRDLLPTAPISDAQWKAHLAIKHVRNIDDLNMYATDLATEMRIYCLNRLENVQGNVEAIISRLKQIKPKKRHNRRVANASKKKSATVTNK